MLPRQRLEHGDDSLADVGVQVAELAGHVRKSSQAVRVKVLVLKFGQMSLKKVVCPF